MQIFIYCQMTLHVSGGPRAHHQEYIKLVAASGTDHTVWGASFLKRDQIRTPYLVTFKEACSPDSTICTRGCNYSFMYS